MRSQKKLCFSLLAAISLLAAYLSWTTFHANSTRRQVLSLMEQYDSQRLSPSNTITAAKILGSIENPYPYVLEVSEIEDREFRKRYIAAYDHFPDFLKKSLAKPYPAATRRDNACKMLSELSLVDDNLDHIISVLQSTNRLAHKAVWKSLLKRLDNSKAWPYETLSQQVTNSLPIVREFTAEAVEYFAQHDENAQICLTRLMGSQDETVAFKSACAIARKGGAREAAIPVFERIMKSQNPERQGHAAYMMLFISRQHPGIAPAFMAAAASTNSSIRSISLSHLPYCGSRASPYLPHIKTYLHDEDYGVRYAATNAIRRIESAAEEEGRMPLGQPLRFPTETSVIRLIRNELIW